ncbi:MAG: hypothetical protein Q8L78_08545 [Coxiellaceae bacterium]|nr:hypothetical protein [Coxiellaceae bacterium]
MIKSSALLSATLVTALLASSVYAGGPDVMAMPAAPAHSLFTTVEGGYSWNNYGNTIVAIHPTTPVQHIVTPSNNGGTGRVAIGAIHYSTYCPKLSYTAEAGWGYYGSTSYTASAAGINAKNYMYGFDALAGVDYEFTSKIDGFFKLGALFENTKMNRNTDLGTYTGGIVTSGTENVSSTTSSILPELKVGGVYNITDAWGLTAAYMFAYGNGNVSSNIRKTATTEDKYVTNAPASINSLLFGLQYKFA